MSGHRKFSELREELEQRPGHEERAEEARRHHDAEDAAYHASLAQVRQARRLTQVQLAEQSGLSQGEISRIERRSDLYLSTLERYLQAMGGELRLIGQFGDHRVELAVDEAMRLSLEPMQENIKRHLERSLEPIRKAAAQASAGLARSARTEIEKVTRGQGRAAAKAARGAATGALMTHGKSGRTTETSRGRPA
jgi:transcriptional regulator with XRE-family HTH domain